MCNGPSPIVNDNWLMFNIELFKINVLCSTVNGNCSEFNVQSSMFRVGKKNIILQQCIDIFGTPTTLPFGYFPQIKKSPWTKGNITKYLKHDYFFLAGPRLWTPGHCQNIILLEKSYPKHFSKVWKKSCTRN